MRILWIKAGGLIPFDTGGKIRSYQILRELARTHEVTLFTFYAAHPDDKHGELARTFAHVEYVPLPLPARSGLREAIHYIRRLASRFPYTMAKYDHPAVKRRLRALVRARRYDVIVCDFIYPAGIVPWDHPGPKVLFTDNVEALIWQRHLQVASNPLWKAICWLEQRKMARAERRTCGSPITPSRYPPPIGSSSPVTSMRPGSPLCPPVSIPRYFQPSSDEEQPDTIGFTGSMDWMANEDAVLYFVARSSRESDDARLA